MPHLAQSCLQLLFTVTSHTSTHGPQWVSTLNIEQNLPTLCSLHQRVPLLGTTSQTPPPTLPISKAQFELPSSVKPPPLPLNTRFQVSTISTGLMISLVLWSNLGFLSCFLNYTISFLREGGHGYSKKYTAQSTERGSVNICLKKERGKRRKEERKAIWLSCR